MGSTTLQHESAPLAGARVHEPLDAAAPATDWPRASNPLRVAMLGWARLSHQAGEGSGYNLSASELASGLALSGHSVSYLASGIRFSPVPGPRVKPLERWRGIDCFELVNSPNCSPSACNFKNVRSEMRSPRQSRLVLKWLNAVRAEVVHIHSLEGYAMDLVKAIRDSGRPVVVTTHNYWFVCPQVDLLQHETHLCEDFDGGRACVGCLKGGAYWPQRTKRTVGQWLESAFGAHLADVSRKIIYGVVDRARMNGTVQNVSANSMDSHGESEVQAEIDAELGLGFDVSDRASHNGEVAHAVQSDGEEPAELGCSPIDQNERFLRANHHLVVLNDYGRRRVRGVEALNQASMVTPPSDFMRQVYIKMGVAEEQTRTIRLGQPHFDQINRRARRSPYYDVRPWHCETSTGPLRFGFFGTTRHNKGLDILIRAIPLLEKDVRQRCQFLVRASGWDWPFRKRVLQFPEVQFAGGYDLHQLIGAWGEYDVGILPHIWFENSPLVMLEHLHAGKMVVTSRLGGPAEWIVEQAKIAVEVGDAGRNGAARQGDGRCGNGLFFPGGDPEGLATCITRLVTGEVVVPSPCEVHKVTPYLQSYPGHVSEVASMYAGLLAKTSG